jgi:hypothetical protein
MATLNNPINPQNIVDRFADYVTTTANAGIVWGTNVSPFAEFNTAEFGGTTSGKSIGISGANIGAIGSTITAANIYNTLVSETNTYTNIRNLRAILFVEGDGDTVGDGGGIGSRPTPGVVYDNTQTSYLNANYLQNIGSPNASNVGSNNTVTSTGLEQFFTNLQSDYNTARASTATIQVNVCHASCHSSCHGSRSRR